MSDAFIGEVRPVGFDFAPRGWAMCNGQLLPIAQNTALFSLLGTRFGGNGLTTFGLPDLRTVIPLHSGLTPGDPGAPGLTPVDVGQSVGVATVNLGSEHLPQHLHVPIAVDAPGTTNSPGAAAFARPHTGRVTDRVYATGGDLQQLAANALGPSGGNQSHNNLPPYLVINFVIALQGTFPPRD